MTVTSVSGVSANGMTVSVANPTSTPQITVGTSASGVLKGVSGAVQAAVARTDYLAPGQARAQFTPEAFGAAGNGTTDDTTALNNCFAAAGGADVFLNPAKTYKHTNVLTVGQNGTRITGGGTLLATVEAASAVNVTGNFCLIAGVTLAFSQSGATRQYNPQADKLWVTGSHFTGIDVYINGSASIGVYMDGAAYFTLEGVYVYNTLADGIHCTGGAHDGQIIGCTSDTTGDDGFAVVSYQIDGVLCSNIVNVGSRSINGAARGFTIGGGHRIGYYNGRVDSSADAGIYIAVEPSYELFSITDCVVDGFEIYGANTAANSNPQGGICFYNGLATPYVIERVTVRNCTLINTTMPSSGSGWQVQFNSSYEGGITDIILDRVIPTGTGPTVPIQFSPGTVAATDFLANAELLSKRVYITSTVIANPGLDQVLLLGPGGTAQLPPAARCSNQYSVTNVDTASHNVTPTGSDTISGWGSSYAVEPGATIDFISDQTNTWFPYTQMGMAAQTVIPITWNGGLEVGQFAEYVYLIQSGGAPVLPNASGITSTYTFKNTTTSAATISTTASQTIDGSTTYSLAVNASISVVSDGSNWHII